MNTWGSRRNGFTIAEMTVVIVIIAILASIVLVSYSLVLQRTRDAERKSDVTKVRIALDKYYAANGQFPGVCSGDNTGCAITALATPLNTYLSSLPTDPSGPANEYQYIRGGTSGNSYAIRINYEASPDCMIGIRMTSTWWSSLPVCD